MTRTEKRLAEIKNAILQLESEGIRPTKNAVFDIVGGNRQRTFILYDQAMDEIGSERTEQADRKNKELIDSFPPPSPINQTSDDLIRIAQNLPLIVAKAQEDQFCTLTKRHHLEIQALNAEHAETICKHKAEQSELEARYAELETVITNQAAEIRALSTMHKKAADALAYAEASLAEERHSTQVLQAALDEARDNRTAIESFRADFANLITQTINRERKPE